MHAIFSEIAPGYDRMNRLMTLNLDRRWRGAAVRQVRVQPGEVALDVCCGTGDFLPLLREAGAQAYGLDFCEPMLSRAEPKAGGAGRLSLGDATELPIATASVDVVTVGWGIRNVPDIDRAHQEIARVLKSGGRFVSVDTAIPRNRFIRATSGALLSRALPWLGALFSNQRAYRYLPESTERFLGREELGASMERAGFSEVGWRDLMFGTVCMHFGVKRS